MMFCFSCENLNIPQILLFFGTKLMVKFYEYCVTKARAYHGLDLKPEISVENSWQLSGSPAGNFFRGVHPLTKSR